MFLISADTNGDHWPHNVAVSIDLMKFHFVTCFSQSKTEENVVCFCAHTEEFNEMKTVLEIVSTSREFDQPVYYNSPRL